MIVLEAPMVQTWFFEALASDQSLAIVGLAFLGGVVSSLLPCTVGMLPVLIGYIGSYGGQTKWEVFRQTALFILGVALVMSALGVGASLLGLTFGAWLGQWLYVAIGLLAIVMGVHMLEWIQVPIPQFVQKLPEVNEKSKWVAPIVLGMAFGATASPCGTPFLAAILGLISQQQNIALGAVSLFCYALGQGVLLLVIGLFTGFIKHMAALRQVGHRFGQLSAAVFILAGLLLLAHGFGFLSLFV